MARLLLLEGDEERAAPLVPGQVCTVGRLASCELSLNEPQSSRRHFQIEPRGTRWVLVDLGSRNGTFLNDDRVSEQVPLRHGDLIRVGETTVRYEAEPPAIPAGTSLGNAVLQEPCGRSEYGCLYQGHQPSLDRSVLVEVLDPDLSGDPEERKRYLERARRAGAFEHSCVLAVYDVGSERDLAYTVFEAFPGLTLEDLLLGRPLPRRQAWEVLRQLGEGLAHIHARGKRHGALTPRAVRLDPDGARVKLCELGEAPDQRVRPHRTDGLLQALYAAPEEARGEAGGPAADVFSLGVIAHRILAGSPLCPGRRKEQVLARLAEPTAAAPQAGALEPGEREVLERLLAWDPADRPDARTAANLFAALISGGRAVEASDATRKDPRKAPPRAEPARPAEKEPRKASARHAQGEAARKGSGRLAGPKGAGAADGPAPRRVSDRLARAEPAAGPLPVRLGLLGLGYTLIFSAAALATRAILRLLAS